MTDSYSRRGAGRSKQDAIGKTICERVSELFHSRWKYLCPFNIVKDPIADLFMFALTPMQWQAFRYLAEEPRFSRVVQRTQQFAITNKRAGYLVRVFAKEYVPDITVPFENLPEEIGAKLHYWQMQSRAYRDEWKGITALAKECVQMCSTPGQIQRVWPELLGFMPNMTKEQRIEAKVKSPYPDSAFVRDKETGIIDTNKLHRQWEPDYLAFYSDAITEALILPKFEAPKDAPSYPEIVDMVPHP